MSSSSARRLALHASALSDAEYELYTTSLCELALVDDDDPQGRSGGADDTYFENMNIGVREARAWLRGRYNRVSVGVIDKILKLFSPNIGPTDVLSGSEFFAALRLVIHAENGAEVDRSLAFVQANPIQNPQKLTTSSRVPSSRPPVEAQSLPSTSRTSTSSPRKGSSDLPPPPPHHPHVGSSAIPPPMPSRRPHTESIVSASTRSSKSNNTPDPASSSTHNPFSHPQHDYQTSTSSSPYRSQPPLHPSQRSETSKSSSSAVGPQSSNATGHSAHNPFVHRPPALQPQSRSDDGTGTNATRIPPLPPRKPPPPVPLVPPPQHASTRNRGERSTSPSKHPNPFPHTAASNPPPKLPHHVTSNLIKQSLQASKVAQSMKRAEEQLEKERVMQVLKSSSVVPGSYSLAGASIMHSSVVIGTHVHNQHQMGRAGGGGSPERESRVYGTYASSSVSASSESESAPPLPQRRKPQQQQQPQYAQYREQEDDKDRYRHHQQQQQPSPPLSASSMEQVALASLPPTQTKRNLNYSQRSNTADPFVGVSPFRSPVDPASPPRLDSPEHSPSRSSSTSHRPPTHPDRKPYLPYQALPQTSFPSTHDHDDADRRSFDDIYGDPSPDPPSPGRRQPSDFPPQQQARVFRSRSMHQTSPTQAQLQTLPPPPVRRKRPESVQVLTSGEVLMGSLSRAGGEGVGLGLGRSGPGVINTTPHRRSSLSVSMTPTSNSNANIQESPLTNFQRTIAATIQPKLDKARYKAEAGLSKRGFVRDSHGRGGAKGEEEEGLMSRDGPSESARGRKAASSGWAGTPLVDKAGVFDDPEVDEDWSRSRGMDGTSVDGNGDEDVFNEKDNLKWPSGEGWKPL